MSRKGLGKTGGYIALETSEDASYTVKGWTRRAEKQVSFMYSNKGQVIAFLRHLDL